MEEHGEAGWRALVRKRGRIKVKLQWGKACSAECLNGAVHWLWSLSKEPIVNVHWHNARSPGDLSLALSLRHSSSHVTAHKHWHTDRSALSLQAALPPRLNRLFSSNTIQQPEGCRYKAISQQRKIHNRCSHTHTHTLLRSLCSASCRGKQWGDSAGDSANSDSDRLWFFFSSPLSSLLFLCPFWMSHWEYRERHTPRPGSARSLLLSGKHGWVVCSSVITNVKGLFISSNPLLYSLVGKHIYTHTHGFTARTVDAFTRRNKERELKGRVNVIRLTLGASQGVERKCKQLGNSCRN